MTNRQIGEEMFLAEKTVKNYVSSLLAKLGLERRTQAAVFAAKHLGSESGSWPERCDTVPSCHSVEDMTVERTSNGQRLHRRGRATLSGPPWHARRGATTRTSRAQQDVHDRTTRRRRQRVTIDGRPADAEQDLRACPVAELARLQQGPRVVDLRGLAQRDTDQPAVRGVEPHER